MSYRVRLTPAAARDFDGLPPPVQKQVNRRFDVLALNPRPPQFKPLAERALKGSCRLHVGPDWCIGYRIDDAARTVDVWLIGRRDRFYEEAKRRRQ